MAKISITIAYIHIDNYYSGGYNKCIKYIS